MRRFDLFDRRGRSARLAIGLAIALACVTWVRARTPLARSTSVLSAPVDASWPSLHSPAVTAASGPPTFRLGDAARPFGWSTVVADFNTDGRPDVAVADHAGMTAGSYRYRLELSISGQERRDVTFESSRDAITVSVADVDHDDDLDLVVQTPLLGETVAVWLNDGQGHFTAGDAVQALAAARWSSSVSTTEPVGSPAYAEAPAPRVDVAPSGAAACIPTPSTSRFVVLAPLDPRSSLHSSPQIPRAPPALALSSAI